MNKKGGLFDILMPVGCIFFAIFVLFAVICSILMDEATKKSCEDIGMEYYYMSEQKFCIDIEGNAHYVKIDCKGWIPVECKARIISIGDMRIKD